MRVAAAVFPWAPRHERQAAINAAKLEREASRAGKAHAEAVEAEIRHLTGPQANHYAQIIAQGIIQGHHYRRNGK